MKKINVFLVMVCLIGIGLTSCVKDNDYLFPNGNMIDKTSTAQCINQLKSSSFNGSYLFSSPVGHKAADCKSKCTYLNGVYFHVDCQGFGKECNFKASVNISKALPYDTADIYYNGLGLYAYEPIEDSIYNMPNRSFYMEGERFRNGHIWINIPEQLLRRDENTKKFVYRNITFSDTPLFDNL